MVNVACFKMKGPGEYGALDLAKKMRTHLWRYRSQRLGVTVYVATGATPVSSRIWAWDGGSSVLGARSSAAPT